MTAVLFVLLMSQTAPVKCGGSYSVDIRNDAITLFRNGKKINTGKKPVNLRTLKTCNYQKKLNMLRLDTENTAWIFHSGKKEIVFRRAVFTTGEMADETGLKIDSKTGDIYRQNEETRLCNGIAVSVVLEKWNKNKGQYEPLNKVSRINLEKVRKLKAEASVITSVNPMPMFPWRADIISSDIRAGSETPSPVKIVDSDATTSWVGKLGKYSFINFSTTIMPFGVKTLRIFPGNYADLKSLKNYARIKSFFIVTEKSVFKVNVPWKKLNASALKTPFIVNFPEVQKTKCISVVIDTLSTEKKPSGFSEFTVYTSIDYEKNPIKGILNAFSEGKLSHDRTLKILSKINIRNIEEQLKITTDHREKKILIEAALLSGDERFLDLAVRVLGWAENELLRLTEKYLMSSKSTSRLEKLIKEKNIAKEYALRALGVYVQLSNSNVELISEFLGAGTRKDYEIRKRLEKSIRIEKRKEFIERLCKVSHNSGAFYWLMARWIKKDRSIIKSALKCLNTTKVTKLSALLRYLYAVRMTSSPQMVSKVSAIYNQHKLAVVKLESIRTLLALGDTGFVLKSFNPSDPAHVLTIVRYWPKPEFPEKVMSIFNNTRWGVLKKAFLMKAGMNCSNQLDAMLIKTLESRERDLYPLVTTYSSSCKVSQTVYSKMADAMKSEKDLSMFALLGDSLSKNPQRGIEQLVRNKTETVWKLLQKKGNEDKEYAFTLLIRALSQFNSPKDNILFTNIASNEVSRPMLRAAVDILAKRCPTEVMKIKASGKFSWREEYILNLKKICSSSKKMLKPSLEQIKNRREKK
ncbi:MAG: hypothetical protein JXR95_09815 [Deltaproteobacteria bacterium]|nr:hypothetical protein [Deltaproteobacteria bacterium]